MSTDIDFEKITYFLSTNLNKEKIKEKVKLYSEFSDKSKDYNKSINYITENMLPVSYIPFIYNDNKGINYRNIYGNNEIVGIYDKSVIGDDSNLESNKTTERLNKNLKYALENIESPTKCYNSFNIDNLILFCIISWIIVFVLVLKWVYYYYKDIYIYILITFMIILLAIAVIFKMMMTLNY